LNTRTALFLSWFYGNSVDHIAVQSLALVYITLFLNKEFCDIY